MTSYYVTLEKNKSQKQNVILVSNIMLLLVVAGCWLLVVLPRFQSPEAWIPAVFVHEEPPLYVCLSTGALVRGLRGGSTVVLDEKWRATMVFSGFFRLKHVETTGDCCCMLSNIM